jgi:hypothetical protein
MHPAGVMGIAMVGACIQEGGQFLRNPNPSEGLKGNGPEGVLSRDAYDFKDALELVKDQHNLGTIFRLKGEPTVAEVRALSDLEFEVLLYKADSGEWRLIYMDKTRINFDSGDWEEIAKRFFRSIDYLFRFESPLVHIHNHPNNVAAPSPNDFEMISSFPKARKYIVTDSALTYYAGVYDWTFLRWIDIYKLGDDNLLIFGKIDQAHLIDGALVRRK